MNPKATSPPLLAAVASFGRLSVAAYHHLTRHGFLTEGDKYELLEGHLVPKMSRNPPHDNTIRILSAILTRLIPAGWMLSSQLAVTLADSEPEPDFAVTRGDLKTYSSRHPGPADIGLVIEVAEWSLDSDRIDKVRIYARACLPIYWIVNLVDGQIEVYEQPSGPVTSPAYGALRVYKSGDSVPLILDGVTVAQIPVADLMP